MRLIVIRTLFVASSLGATSNAWARKCKLSLLNPLNWGWRAHVAQPDGFDGFSSEVASKFFFSMKKDREFFLKFREQQIAMNDKAKARPSLGRVRVSEREIEYSEQIDTNGNSERILVSNDRNTIVKEYSANKQDTLLREVIQTEFFQKKGLPVIPILEIDLQNNRITKPFVLGAAPDQQQLYGFDSEHKIFEINPATLETFTKAHIKLGQQAGDLLLTKEYRDYVKSRLKELGLPEPSENDLKKYSFSDLGKDGLSHRRENFMMRLTSEGFQLLVADP